MFFRRPRALSVAQSGEPTMSLEHSPARAGNEGIDRIIGERECRQITDLSRTTRWRLMQADKFPKKFHISPNRTGWMLSSVLSWLAQRQPTA